MRALLVLAAPALAAAPAPARKRDVLMIAIDDMRPEQGCYGCGYMHTPHMDRCVLAASSEPAAPV